MKAATGQSGVSIAIDNVVIESYTGSTSYTDLDGIGATDNVAASVVISDKHTVKEYLAMTSEADYQQDFGEAMGWAYDSTADEWTKTGQTAVSGLAGLVKGEWDEASALSIDVGVCEALSAGKTANYNTAVTVAGVVIGLPTLLINTSSDTYTVGISRAGAANSGANYIQINKGASITAILGGTVEIAPH